MIAEFTKIRSVRSTYWTLLAGVATSVGLAFLIGSAFASRPDVALDPLFATFYSLTLGQLGLVVFAILVVTGEYGSRTIRTSLVAVPVRGRFYAAKLAAGTCTVLGVAVVTVLATFGAARVALGPLAPGWTAEARQAVVGAVLYLALICLFAMGVAAMLRSSVAALAILLPLLFLGSQGLGNVPKLRTVTQYLPDQVGFVILHLTGPAGDPRFGRDYGPWTGIGILALWALAAVAGGYLVLRRRDA